MFEELITQHNISGSSDSTGSFGNVEILGSGLPTKVGGTFTKYSEDVYLVQMIYKYPFKVMI